FSKIEAGKLDLERAPFRLRETLEGALDILALRAHRKGLELVCRVAPDVPDCLLGDRVRLHQVLVNLLGNAIKFTEQGEVVVEVVRWLGGWVVDEPATAPYPTTQPPNHPTTQPPSHPTTLHFSVRDTGPGVPPDQREAIFRPFSQADGSLTRK